MGIPKFFRYTSERYPCISEKINEYQVPEFDNLYLDMNGIIHVCSHPDDKNLSFRIAEDIIFKNIFHYTEILFRIIQPQKLFFLAVDGVAPRAKINQQRSRRFRTAKDCEIQEAKAKERGTIIPEGKRFDSNCITPGTVFMSKLNEQLKYFITYKISTDKLWQKCEILFSGSEVPGEGEHKIMDYIRYIKSQPDYDGSIRHCLYGLDADLIILGLCSHELHFSLLREEVKFNKAQKKTLSAEETTFCLLHLSLMREYLEHEFSPIKDKLSFKFDIENIIDDWILMSFLVGNDFIPQIPNLHIDNGALPFLYEAYMEILPTLNGYINEGGILNLERFEKFIERLSRHDMEQFDEIYSDLKYFEGLIGRRLNENERNNKNYQNEIVINQSINNLEMPKLDDINDEDDEEEQEDDDDSDEYNDMYHEFELHKRDYYMNKMEYENVDAEIMRSQAEGYIKAIQWNLHYYYNGCCSWSWYYPHHYAPFISDIKNFKDLKIEFEMGTPFLPFEQLLAALPAASQNLLPEAYRKLMTDENSLIIDYYPKDFKTDLNGKRQDWEAVVLIPIIDEKLLLEAMKPCNDNLTTEEKERNQHGPMYLFSYTEKSQGIYKAPEYFPNIESYAQFKIMNRDDILVSQDKLVKGLSKGAQINIYYFGFSSLRHVPHRSQLMKAKVKVFEQPSRRENMILTVLSKQTPPIENLAQKWIGKTVYVGWPHLLEALVIGLSNSTVKISIMPSQSKQLTDENINFQTEIMNEIYLETWKLLRKSIIETYKNHRGIEVGDIEIIVHACPLVGTRYVYSEQGKMKLEKQWSDNAMAFAYQVTLSDILIHNQHENKFKSITDVFKPKSVCFMLGHPHYGAMGEVTESEIDLKSNRIKVAMRVLPEPNFNKIQQSFADTRLKYMTVNIAAQRLSISNILLSKITGTIFVRNENYNNAKKYHIGLNLKSNKKNEEITGFTKKENNVWLYSLKTINLVRGYMQKFPELFEQLEKNISSSYIFMTDNLFPEKGSKGLEEVLAWLKEQQETLELTQRSCGSEILEPDVVQAIEKELNETFVGQQKSGKTVLMQVKPHLLYRPGFKTGTVSPDPKAQHCLLDRIVCTRESFTVPLGYKGTIIGIEKDAEDKCNIYDVLFDKPFAEGLAIHGSSSNRSYRLTNMDFVNISYGIQIEKKNINKFNVIAPCKLNLQKQQQQEQQRQQQQQPNRLNHRAPERSNWRQPHMIPPRLQNQSPNLAAHNYLQSIFSKDNQNNKRNQRSQNTFEAWPSQDKTPVVLQRQTDSTRKHLPPVQNFQQTSGSQSLGNSEFQTLWNELNKIQKPMESPKRQAISMPKDKSHKMLEACSDSPQDPSAFLKAILKISDENTQSNKESSATTVPQTNKPLQFMQMSKATDTPPLVQQLFDHARQTELKSDKSTFYRMQVSSHFQMLGTEMPRYIYGISKDDLVCIQVLLPDARVFYGDFCCTYNEAVESAAKKVYEELKLEKREVSLCPPPLQWFNNRMSNVRPPGPQPVNMNPVLPSAFPQGSSVRPVQSIPPITSVPPIQIPMPKWSPAVMHQPVANYGPHISQQLISQPKQQLHFIQHAHTNYSDGNKPNKHEFTIRSTPFVPLQAQKKTRNIVNKLASSNEYKQYQEHRLQQKQHQQNRDFVDKKADQKSKDSDLKQTKQEIIHSKCNESVSQCLQMQNVQNTQKGQKSINKRRSRVAAKFQSDPIINGSDRQ